MKIKSIQFINHKILGNLFLDFTNEKGEIVDTILIAGENGTGKSTLLNELFNISTYNLNVEVKMECLINNQEYKIEYYKKENYMYIKFNNYNNIQHSNNNELKSELRFSAIFSDVAINFNSVPISNVTSLKLDDAQKSKKSDNNVSSDIKQLMIDVQAIDDAEIAQKYRTESEDVIINQRRKILSNERMNRFKKSFDFMFDDLKYKSIENVEGHKEIFFERGKDKISIDNLSSGEKQIIYRGGFLLKDQKALEEPIVLIDEPEISLHPEWQKKILNFYKKIFKNSENVQTSQIFVVTHSPFIIHNEFRENDKVIVLYRNQEGNIEVSNKPEYYSCQSLEVVKDAFNFDMLSTESDTVYLEGRTDEMYFKKALQVYGIKTDVKFKWIGHLDENGEEAFTGKSSLQHAFKFTLNNNFRKKQIFLMDNDGTKKDTEKKGNSFLRVLPFNKNNKIVKGIENLLNLDGISLEKFHKEKLSDSGYGVKSRIMVFEKMKFCEEICNMDNEKLKYIFQNIKIEIDKILEICKGDL